MAHYSNNKNAFISPKPYNSWALYENSFCCLAPIWLIIDMES